MIGIIDSGLGGLAVAKAIWQRLPGQATLYFGDEGYFPYGQKSEALINRRLVKIFDWLIYQGCRLVVIACNTITAAAIDKLRLRYKIPIVGTEPAVKSGGVVLVTPATARSRRYRQLAKLYPVTTIACPGLAKAIESGLQIDKFLPKLPKNTRRLVLGCTHYLLVKNRLKKIYGPGVALVDPSAAIARQTAKLLRQRQPGPKLFFTSGEAEPVSRRASELLRRRIMFNQCSL